jgi:hypothetical protein
MSGSRSKPSREFIMWTTLIPRLAMKPRMNPGKSAPGIRSGRSQISSAYGSICFSQRFDDGCVVISEGDQRRWSMWRNQSTVPLSEPPRSTHGAR